MIKLVAPFSSTGGSVVSVNGKMGVVVLTPEDIGALREGALEGYATEQYVQDQIKDIDIPETDLTGYATESYVQEKIAEAELGGSGEVDLSAYATKQYVSEQVNAIELMPGPTGPQGPKGNDGYTPVKGVDYFDGAPGAAGKDGYTPVKGVDYFDGKDGAPGKDGKDYVLTDADKQEIAGMVEVTGGGEGGSVNIDNRTIIEENGAIRTAIDVIQVGGAAREDIYNASNSNGFTTSFNEGDNYVVTGVTPSGWKAYQGVDLRYEIECFQNGNSTKVLEANGDDWAVGEVFKNSGSGMWMLRLLNFSNIGAGYGDEVFINHNGLLASSAMPSDFKLYRITVYTPTIKGTYAVANECIDTNYIATRDYVAELIGGIENGSY